MSEQQVQEPVFQIQRVYLKDVSLEQPNSPAIFSEQDSPDVDVQLQVQAAPVAEGFFEVVVTATVTAKIKDRTLFLVEGHQAGLFEIRHIPDEQINPIIGIACPNIVYPYLRANIADLITRAGFPPVNLAEMNFEAMYQAQMAQAMQEAQAAAQAGQVA